MKKYRNEWKYLITKAESKELSSRIGSLLERDRFANDEGWYTVQSIYFDDIYDSCLQKNISGDGIRYKYRIRYYNDSFERIVLERKEKYNSYCYKESCELSQNELKDILQGNVNELLWQESRLKKEFALAILNKGFSPKANISYKRYAFVESISNVRITFDSEIKVNDDFEYDDYFQENKYYREIINDKYNVLEVKFDYILPSYIRRIFLSKTFNQQAFSKYYQGRKEISKSII